MTLVNSLPCSFSTSVFLSLIITRIHCLCRECVIITDFPVLRNERKICSPGTQSHSLLGQLLKKNMCISTNIAQAKSAVFLNISTAVIPCSSSIVSNHSCADSQCNLTAVGVLMHLHNTEINTDTSNRYTICPNVSAGGNRSRRSHTHFIAHRLASTHRFVHFC